MLNYAVLSLASRRYPLFGKGPGAGMRVNDLAAFLFDFFWRVGLYSQARSNWIWTGPCFNRKRYPDRIRRLGNGYFVKPNRYN
jgi:hypothetical protein